MRARNGVIRPTLGTDVAETDGQGEFELRLPAGEYALDAAHPRYAGVSTGERLEVRPGERLDRVLTMTAGCVVAGRVVGPNGHPSGDGAIERQWGDGAHEFTPVGRIEADGSFRWPTTEATEVSLRAWPWRSPPSNAQKFACKDGARFDNIVFQLPDIAPDIDGVLVDATGGPVAFAFIDLSPLDEGGIGQQERTDAQGRWQVFSMPAGRYAITAHAPHQGVAVATVLAPSHGAQLAFGGIGRIEGFTSLLANGSFELTESACMTMDSDLINPPSMAIPQDRRIVSVTNGRFAIDEVPACELTGTATWHEQNVRFAVTVPAGGSGYLQLEIGPPHSKTVRGVVKDITGRPVEGARVKATYRGDRDITVVTDAAGRYELSTFSGTSVFARAQDLVASGDVSMTNVDVEQLDLVLEPSPQDEEPQADD